MEWCEVNIKQCGVDISELKKYINNDMGYKVKHIISEELFLVPA